VVALAGARGEAAAAAAARAGALRAFWHGTKTGIVVDSDMRTRCHLQRALR
jgi:hypothetical protein